MLLKFSNEEKIILMCYIKNDKNMKRTIDNYFDMYPKIQFGRTYFHALGRNLLEFGSFEKFSPKQYETNIDDRRNILR